MRVTKPRPPKKTVMECCGGAVLTWSGSRPGWKWSKSRHYHKKSCDAAIRCHFSAHSETTLPPWHPVYQ